jgi:hypothetical protein
MFERPARSEFCFDLEESSFLSIRYVNESTKRFKRFAVPEQWEETLGLYPRI